MKIDVIIPLYKPGRELLELLRRLGDQTVPVNRILLLNTQEELLHQKLSDEEIREANPVAELFHIRKEEFDHGGTRHKGVLLSRGEIFVMLTQDAMPADERLIENLIGPLSEEGVAVAYGRQLVREDSSILESISREFNYPAESRIKSSADFGELGIKTFFCSNVCAAYRRDLYDKLGGFAKKTIFNEDMIYAGNAVQKGYRIAYCADARVIHSHNYSCIQQFHRNFDLGVSQAMHPEVFAGVKSESEGKRLVKVATSRLLREGHPLKLFGFYLQCAFKYAGYLCGKRYKKLPEAFVRRASDNKAFWDGSEL